MSVKLAVEKFCRKQIKKNKPRQVRQRNESPEKQTEKEVLNYCLMQGFDVSVVESKAVYSRSAGRYLRGQTEAGFSDIVGTDKNGFAVFIELKASGKLKTISQSQTEFLKRKIESNAFACCVDSSDMLDHIYNNWLNLKSSSSVEAKKYLMSILPKNNKAKDNDFEW
jgi:hypothetical protein